MLPGQVKVVFKNMNEAVFNLVRAVLPDRLRGIGIVANLHLKSPARADAFLYLYTGSARHFLSGKRLGRGHHKVVGRLFEPYHLICTRTVFILGGQRG